MSTIKSSAENLTLNADGANNDIIFQSNGSTQLTLQGSDGSIGMGITTPVGDNARTLHLSDNTGIGFGNGANGRPDFQIQTSDGVRLGFICGEGSSTEDIVMLTSGVLCTPQGIELGSGIDGTASNILDDYEEGTWVPTIVCSTSGSYVMDTGANLLAYTKIGRVVHIQGGCSTASESSPNGNIRMSLPFTPMTGTKDTDYCMGNATLTHHGGTLPNNANLFISGGTTWVSLYSVADDGTTQYIDHNDVDTAWGIQFSMTYIAA